MTKITAPGSRPLPPERVIDRPIARALVKQPEVGDDFGGKGTHSDYKATLRGQTDAQLKADVARLEATIRDASSGADKNPGVVARARAELGEVREEMKTRTGFATSGNPAYAQSVHTMSDSQLVMERLKLTAQAAGGWGTRTGPFNWKHVSPQAQEARAKLEILNKEQAGRAADRAQGALPTENATKPLNVIGEIGYHINASRMTDEQIGAERAKVGRALIDATTGPHTDPVLAANCRKELGILDHVMQARHPQSTPATPGDLAQYTHALHNMSDGQINSERERLNTVVQGWQQNPVGANNARQQLAALDGEVSAREVHRVGFQQELKGMSDDQLNALAGQKEQQLHGWGAALGLVNKRELGEDLQAIKFEQFKRHWGTIGEATPPPAPLPPSPQGPYQAMDTTTLIKDVLGQIDRYKQACQPNGTGWLKFPDFKTMQDAAGKIQQGLAELLHRLHGDVAPQPGNPFGYPPGYKGLPGGDVQKFHADGPVSGPPIAHKMNVELPVGGQVYKIQADQPLPPISSPGGGGAHKMNVELPVGGQVYKIQADQPTPGPVLYEGVRILPNQVQKIKADEPLR
jgi:hypothetical protein